MELRKRTRNEKGLRLGSPIRGQISYLEIEFLYLALSPWMGLVRQTC